MGEVVDRHDRVADSHFLDVIPLMLRRLPTVSMAYSHIVGILWAISENRGPFGQGKSRLRPLFARVREPSRIWRPHGDSNPGYCRERAVS